MRQRGRTVAHAPPIHTALSRARSLLARRACGSRLTDWVVTARDDTGAGTTLPLNRPGRRR